MENKKNLYIMNAIAFFQGIVIYATIAALYREARGLSLSDFAMVESFSYLFTLAFEVPFGFIADKIGYKKTLIISNGVYFLSKIIFFYAYGIPMFLLERLFLAIALAGISGVDTSIIYLSSNEGKSQKQFGYYAAFGTAGMLFGSLLFTMFFYSDYSACAFWTMIAYGVAFLLTFFIDEVKDEEDKKERASIKDLFNVFKNTLRDARFLLFLLSTALIANASFVIAVLINQNKYISLGLNEQHMGIISIVISVAGLFSISSAYLTKKLGVIRFIGIMCFIMAVAALLMGYTKFAIIAIICDFMIDFGYGILVPLINELENERVKIDDRATQLSIYGMIVDLISIVLSGVTSIIADISFFAVFVMVSVELIIAIIACCICYCDRRTK